jgi:hypothetical protein
LLGANERPQGSHADTAPVGPLLARPHGPAPGVAEEHEGRALVRLAGVVGRGTDDHVGVAVAIHVAGPGDAVAHDLEHVIALQLRGGGGGAAVGDAGGAAEEDEGRALVSLALSGLGSARHHPPLAVVGSLHPERAAQPSQLRLEAIDRVP